MSAAALRLHRVEADRLTLRIAGNLEGIDAGQQALHDFLESGATTPRARFGAELAYDELVSNVVKYAYGGLTGDPREIEIVAEMGGDEIVVSIEDDGPPFNPLEVPEPAIVTTLADAQPGGRGIFLVRKTARNVEYERRAGRNCVRVTIQRH